jgi:UDP-N-acetylglucosamine 2-epimerase (non-hydrolysing)
MPKKRKLLVIIGTRPEAIKLAPIVIEAKNSGEFDVRVAVTGQHREMLDQMIRHFTLSIDVDLDIMKQDQSLCGVTTAALDGLHGVIVQEKPDCVVVQGDTTTTFCGALAAFYQNIPVAHVEAGLRTYDRRQPFPEEVNRCLTTQLTDYHFAPTARASNNLLKEGVPPEKIWVTGNTAIDALFYTLANNENNINEQNDTRTLLLTAHRRENHGEPMANICRAILKLVDRYPDLKVIYPVHLSPRVRNVIQPLLGNHERIKLVEPLDYKDFVLAMSMSHFILTDSGGVQEEAPSLGKPVLILREVTERPEAMEAGTAIPVGTDEDRIFSEASRLLDDKTHYKAMSEAKNPYGDGTSAKQIIKVLVENI